MLLICILTILSSCNDQYPEGAIAVVGEDIITKNDIEKEMKIKEIQAKMFKKAQELGISFSKTDKKVLLEQMEVKSEKDLNEEQKQYFDYISTLEKIDITKNEALNNIIRDKVLYKEAQKLGYEDMSKKAMLESITKGEEMHQKNLNDTLIESEAEEYSKLYEYQDSIYTDYGYKSFRDYQEKNIDNIIKNTTSNLLKKNFDNSIINSMEDNNLNSIEVIINLTNAWTNYAEHLLKNADIEILDDEYEIKYYGDEWRYEDLDLKNNKERKEEIN